MNSSVMRKQIVPHSAVLIALDLRGVASVACLINRGSALARSDRASDA